MATSEIGACADNPGARRLYERLGYRVVGEQPEPYAYPRPDGSVDRGTFAEWIFRKPLR
jgi:ribosomal protein S18 acetylase RimI-like enzyme